MTPYPTSLSQDSVQFLLSSFHSGERDIPKLVRAIWDVAGYGLGQMLPEALPLPVPLVQPARLGLTAMVPQALEAEAIPHLQRLCSGTAEKVAISLGEWKQLVPILLPILEQYLQILISRM